MLSCEQDAFFMTKALEQARIAFEKGEVPVGALLVLDGEILAADHNRVETDMDPTAHAEVLSLRRAGLSQKNWRLNRASLYVTLEPCHMCMGAILLARISRLVWGAFDPRMGGSRFHAQWEESCRWATLPDMRGGVLQDEALHLVQTFFACQRSKRNDSSS
ncbi:nucleoside deaminase [Candidatus Similichlamydia epinepheli]|uniref:nucleoside deaminase n=1 Tax=Candidatus Similichlamydia epinepheli TaxID=1903953 RepID=UPI000D34CA63|nr:nucleoside deaminase [Candidatus Similichlamydia epinepheli]